MAQHHHECGAAPQGVIKKKNLSALKAPLIRALESRFQRLHFGPIRIPGALAHAESEESADGAKTHK
jgi:hypothetical protein